MKATNQFGTCRDWSRPLAAVWLTTLGLCCLASLEGVDAFLPSSSRSLGWSLSTCHRRVSGALYVSTDHHVTSVNSDQEDDDDELMDDATLLKMVPKSQLENLCTQNQLSTEGSKNELLARLRSFANEQADLERQRRRDRIARVESGGKDGKERYEIVSDYPEDDDDEGFFYFQAPTNGTASNTTTAAEEQPKKKPSKPAYSSNTVVSAPPPPDVEPNEDGERVVTVYSTKEKNDLTGVASAQPGQSFTDNALMSGEASGPSSAAAPWDMTQHKSQATSEELDEAKETVTELVHALLTMTGAPAFREEFSEGLTPLVNGRSMPSLSSPEGFVGFDPSKVPTDILTASSKALRVGRGEVLQEVLRDYELRAVGHDGMAGDDVENCGGHYREVSKVRAFLEGYRRAEVRRVARETATMLLDNIVTEGVDGLDMTLASMPRSSDDTNEAGELNDSLLDFLNDAIRQQEKKVEQMVGADDKLGRTAVGENEQMVEVDRTAHLWNVTNEKGERIETLDPNDPAVKKFLEEEASKSEGKVTAVTPQTPKTAPEQLLLLLCLLRDRIKAEAAFANDEKGRNLRILAHCLHAKTDAERESIIMKEMGSSLSRLESFSELVGSSVEYAESTSHQLQPSKTGALNVEMLKGILDLTEELREKQALKASSMINNEKTSL